MKIEQIMSLYGDNAHLLDELYTQYRENPSSVTDDWVAFFRELETQSPVSSNGNGAGYVQYSSTEHRKGSSLADFGLINLLNAYRRQGHLAAKVDPLGIHKPDRTFIDGKLQALQSSDLETEVDTGIPGIGKKKLKDVIDWFEKTYCSSIGCEHYYLVNDQEREWLQNRMEPSANSESIPKETALRIYEKIFQADYFENFLAKKFVGKKRFSLEGGEATISVLDTIIEEGGKHNMDGMVIGMAHRGRLNVLVNIFDKPAAIVFAEFEEKNNPNLSYGDVKYHLGYSNVRKTKSGKEVKLSLNFNPSHLEAVDPVIMGSVRARQMLNKDNERSKYMPIAIHGDAAFAGQGVVAETFNLMNLDGYTTGGTFHLVINNQIGFTTLPTESRSTLYATDLAKGYQVPIFHVNGDDPEACYRVAKIALEYRQKFKKDVIIDLVCYRRLGHNETDEPSFTQPQMYEIIKKHTKTVDLYKKQLTSRSDISAADIEAIETQSIKALEDNFNTVKEKDVKMQVDTMGGVWSKFSKEPLDSETHTNLLQNQMTGIVKALTELPAEIVPHKGVQKVIETRAKMAAGETPIDWGFAEMLSFGSILENGFPIRLSGQDAQRGTFSHRHATLNCTKTGKKYTPLNFISATQAKIEVVNSSLSEFSVLGYEYGYSLSDPNSLVIWEAQFGDFANNAQVIFDQFITSSEYKWHRHSGIVLLLPHGYEGQGPEHSSARLERFLQLCAMDNIQVCNCTTAAQYFHLLRRQVLRNFRKPLVLMSPKSLLRHANASSTLEEITTGTFQKAIWDKNISTPKNIEKIIFCSGKVYYDLKDGVEKEKKEGKILLVRLEQLYPFPKEEIQEIFSKYSSAKHYVWAQEEPRNQGAWFFIREKFESVLPAKASLTYAGRKESPSPAAGLMKIHQKEQLELVAEAIQ
jgi:2-oxoglutarate dehydrogenase E1 component